MKFRGRVFFILVLLSFLFPQLLISEDINIDVQGTYLIFSYDYNQIYGENVELLGDFCHVYADYMKIDLASRLFLAVGNVVLEKNGVLSSCDEFLFNPDEEDGLLIRYSETVQFEKFGEKPESSLSSQLGFFENVNLLRFQKSFISFTGLHFTLTENYDVFGYEVTMYIEGLESVGLKKFKLSEGIQQGRNGFYLDSIWYTRSQGITARAGFLFNKEEKINSRTQIYYEEHSILKDYVGLKRQVDVTTSTTLNLSKDLNLGILGNYNSSSQWNAQFVLNKKWGAQNNTQIDFTYNNPLNRDRETWFGLESKLYGEKLGNLFFMGRYELHNQVIANFSYTHTPFKNVDVLLNSSYSQLRIGNSLEKSKIFTGNFKLSYGTKIFNLSSDYYLNQDLFGQQMLSQPQLRFALNTFQLYDGLLSASFSNVFIYNRFKTEKIRRDGYSNNMVFNLSSQPISVRKNLILDFNLAVEQFFEKEGRNFTSGGFIFNIKQILTKGVSLEGFFSAQSRRKSENWFIEGTTSQDLSTILRVNPAENLNAWISFSYDPKNSQWRQSFLDVSIGFLKNWQFHSLANYDFLLNKINNVDLYLIRDTGRFQIRLMWRSLSKQFLIELIPK